MEELTGWAYAGVFPRLNAQVVVDGINRVFRETSLGSMKMSRKRIVLTTFLPERSPQVATAGLPDLACAVRKPYPAVIQEIRECQGNSRRPGSELWRNLVRFETRRVPSPRRTEPIAIEGDFTDRQELNDRIEELLSLWNRGDRSCYPGGKPGCAPLERLHQILSEKQIQFKKKKIPPIRLITPKISGSSDVPRFPE
ncbi:hypothetical protein [Geomonas propionica]|uniref:Uncharacterized protein n=1 Tax=Geomonas propionica TaxID=2798582 RepID=A0ABS0YP81_9BACT|nr:hypothetical protein [Geomonas propionica]MBJ6799734.1 hypothetical protein [Geomonas propionica]